MEHFSSSKGLHTMSNKHCNTHDSLLSTIDFSQYSDLNCMVLASLVLNLLSKYLQMSFTGTALKSKLFIDLDLMFVIWDERSCKLSTLFEEQVRDSSNILRFCFTGIRSENSLAGDLRNCSHSRIKSGKCETFFLYIRELNKGMWLLLTSCISKLVFLCLDADVTNESVDEYRRNGAWSVTIPSMSRYLTSSNGVWLRSCPAMVVVQWWKSVSVST